MEILQTTVRTLDFENQRYRNNKVRMEIPDEAAEIIKKYWAEKQPSKCVWADYLASNQEADCFIENINGEVAGMSCINTFHTEEDEIFKFCNKNEEEEY